MLRPATAHLSHVDSLRGSTTAPARTGWDVTFYDLHVAVHPADSTIAGWNTISYQVLRPTQLMQINLMVPLQLHSVTQDGKALESCYTRSDQTRDSSGTLPSPGAFDCSKRLLGGFTGLLVFRNMQHRQMLHHPLGLATLTAGHLIEAEANGRISLV